MKYLNLVNSGYKAIVDDEDYQRCIEKGDWCLKANHDNPIGSIYCTRERFKINILGRFILNVRDSYIFVDHEDRNPLNNQKYNLRLANASENKANSKRYKNSKYKYKGVYLDKSNNRWMAQIRKDSILTTIGRYNTIEEAAYNYNIKAIELFGKFAVLNIIE